MAKYLSLPSLAITLLLGNQLKGCDAYRGYATTESPGSWGSVKQTKFGWIGTNGGDEHQINSYRVSCKSDRFSYGRNYAGVVVYDGSYPNVLPGYTILAEVTNTKLDHYKEAMRQKGESTEGMVHGYGVWKRFGESPTTMIKRYGMKFAGFAYLNGKVEFDSGTLNARSHWHHNVAKMVDDEKVIIAGLVKAWQQNGIARTYNKRRLTPFICSGLNDFSWSVRSMYGPQYNC